jgi:hypothetical protein
MDSLADHLGLIGIPPKTWLGVPKRKLGAFADQLSLPTNDDIGVYPSGKKWEAQFHCTAAPALFATSAINLPINSSSNTWSGPATGADLRSSLAKKKNVRGAVDAAAQIPPGAVTLELHDPGGAVEKSVEPHERKHAQIWADAYNNVFVPWIDRIVAYSVHGGELSEIAGTKALARAKLWRAVGGKPVAVLSEMMGRKRDGDLNLHADKSLAFDIGSAHYGDGTVRIELEPRG